MKQLEDGDEDILPPTLVMKRSIAVVTYGKLHQVEAKLEGRRLYPMHPDLFPEKGLDPEYKVFWPDNYQ